MLSLNFVILNILFLINTEITLFFITFQKSQENLQDNLKKIKYDVFLPLFEQIKDSSQNDFEGYESSVEGIENLLDESELIFLGQKNLLSKIKSVFKFLSFIEYYHMKSMVRVDKILNENSNRIKELRSSLQSYRTFIDFQNQSFEMIMNNV